MSERLHVGSSAGSDTVLYVDPDPNTRNAVTDAIAAGLDLAVDSVSSLPDPIPEELRCIVIDPAGGVDVDRLSNHPAPVVAYTRADRSLSGSTLAAVETVVPKDGPDSRATLCDRLRTVATDVVGEHVLSETLARTDDLGGDAAYYIVGANGAIEWASEPLSAVVPNAPDSGSFDDRVTRLRDRGAVVLSAEQADGETRRYLTLPDGEGTRHYRLETHRIDGNRRLEVVVDVTNAVDRIDRLERLSSVAEGVEDGVYVVDETGTIVFCNDSFASMFGTEPAALVGDHVTTVYSDAAFEQGREAVERLRTDPEMDSNRVVLTGERRNGRRIDVEVTFTVRRSEDERFAGVLCVARDVTDRKRTERALERASRRYRTLVENFPNGAVALFDTDLRYTLVEGTIFGDLDLEAEALEGQRLVDAHSEAFIEAHLEDYQAALDGEQQRFEFAFGGRTFRAHVVPVRDEDGTVVAGLSMSQDVTEQKEREVRLREVREQMELALEATDAVAWTRDLETDEVTYYPDESARLYGSEVETVESFLGQIHPDDRDRVRTSMETAVEERQPYSAEFRTVVNGETEWRAAQGRVVTDTHGTATRIYGVTQDITDRKSRERALERANRRYRTLVEHFPDGGVFLFDGDGRFVLAGGAGLERAGFASEEFEGSTPHDLFPEPLAQRLTQHFRRALEGTRDTFEVTYQDRHYRIQTVPIRGVDGDVVSGMAVSQDVTERRERQIALRRERDKLARLGSVIESVEPLTEVLTGAATRQDLKTDLCDRLSGSPAYTAAWIGTKAVADDRIRPETVAGLAQERVAEASPPADGTDPVASALRSGEIRAGTHLDDHGVVAVPLLYRSTSHGVLALYPDDPDAVTEQERSVLKALGRRIGQALTAIGNRRLLNADRTMEIRFREQSQETTLSAAAAASDCTLVVAGVTRVGDGDSLFHLTVEDGDPAAAATAIAELAGVAFAREIGGEEADTLQCRYTGPCALDVLVDHGAVIREARFSPEGSTVVAEFASGTDTAAVVEAVASVSPALRVASKREREATPDWEPEQPDLRSRLTERQLEVVEAAYHAGYFDWPRDITAEELADVLDISSPTLHQHLRKVSARLVAAVVGSGGRSGHVT